MAELQEQFLRDQNGNPFGGQTSGIGLLVHWQNGPLGVVGADRVSQNGAFVEDVIRAAIGRLRFFQRTKFACDYNAEAISHLHAALNSLAERTADRTRRGVEGKHEL